MKVHRNSVLEVKCILLLCPHESKLKLNRWVGLYEFRSDSYDLLVQESPCSIKLGNKIFQVLQPVSY